MSKLITLFVLIVFLFPNWAFADQLGESITTESHEVKGDLNVPITEAVEVVLSPAQKNLELLVEKYKEIKKEIQLKSDDALRLEGAIILCQEMVKNEKAVKEVTALEETTQQEEK